MKLKKHGVVGSAMKAMHAGRTAHDAFVAGGAPGFGRSIGRHSVRRVHRLVDQATPQGLERWVKLSGVADVRALQAELQALPDVEYAEPNLVVHANLTTDDPYLSSSGSWGQSFDDLWNLKKISAPAAWDQTEGAGVTVAVIDTGIDFTHPDLSAQIWQNPGEIGTDASGLDKRTNGIDDDGNGYVDDWEGYDFTGTSGDNDPTDDFGHGTHVAGIVAATANNGEGIVGVAPAAKVMPVKVLDSSGGGTLDAIVSGIYYAAKNGARVINMSLGGFSNEPVPSLVEAIQYAHDTKNVVVVAAAGNNATDVGDDAAGFYPARLHDAIAVAATDHLDALAPFSNRGPKIDLAAPGGGDTDPGVAYEPQRSILSLLAAQANDDMTGSGQLVVGTRYLRQAGTSMAAPHVAGAAALVLAAHPTYNAEQVRQALRTGATDTGPAGWDTEQGYGRLDAAEALAVSDPLGVQLNASTTLVVGTSTVDITGSVTGSNAQSWELSYGVGSVPTSWTSLASGTGPIQDAQLLAWDVSDLADGVLTLRLVATDDQNRTFEDRLPIDIDNAKITSPTDQFWTKNASIPIIGTVVSPSLSYYTVTIYGFHHTWVDSSRINVTNGGQAPVSNGVLATWDTTGTEPDNYGIFLNAYDAAGNRLAYEHVTVMVDPTLLDGYPLELDNGMPISGQLVAADLNGDGAQELLVSTRDHVWAYQHDGSVLPGWPQSVVADNLFGGAVQSPVVGDINGDGQPDVVVGAGTAGIYAWNADGTTIPGFPIATDYQVQGYALADIDADGVLDVVVSGGNRMAVYGGNGSPLPGWPVVVPSPSTLYHPAIGDINGDGNPEIVSATQQGRIFAFDTSGNVLAGWPQDLAVASGAIHFVGGVPLADLDGDGALDIVAALPDGSLTALHGDGTTVAGFPQQLGTVPLNEPSVGDVDGDGRPEIFVGALRSQDATTGAYSETLYALHGDGSALSGWPVVVDQPNPYPSISGIGAPALADIDGDGEVDIIAAGDIGNRTTQQPLLAYHADGTPVSGFPRPTIGWIDSSDTSPVVADLDGDGLQELAWVGTDGTRRMLAAWNLTAPSTAPAPWPMAKGSPQQQNAYAASAAPSGSNPCAGLCDDPVVFTSASYQPPPLGTGATCHETVASLSGGTCWGMDQRTISVNGVPVSCNGWVLPAKRNGGYCIQVTAGDPDWAGFATW